MNGVPAALARHKPDVVLLATPPGFRPAQLAYAVKAGRHVFCEKPVAVVVLKADGALDFATLEAHCKQALARFKVPRELHLRAALPHLKAAGGSALFIKHDIADEASWAEVIEKTETAFGGLDILVQNAGIYPWTLIENTSPEEWDKVLAVEIVGDRRGYPGRIGHAPACPASRGSGKYWPTGRIS